MDCMWLSPILFIFRYYVIVWSCCQFCTLLILHATLELLCKGQCQLIGCCIISSLCVGPSVHLSVGRSVVWLAINTGNCEKVIISSLTIQMFDLALVYMKPSAITTFFCRYLVFIVDSEVDLVFNFLSNLLELYDRLILRGGSGSLCCTFFQFFEHKYLWTEM